jgi:hypothetical protein
MKFKIKYKKRVVVGNEVFNLPDETVLEVLGPYFSGVRLKKYNKVLHCTELDFNWSGVEEYKYKIISLP